MKILALCGSIRKESSNYALLQAVKKIFPGLSKWDEFDLKLLPYFDPQLQFSSDLPSLVQELRKSAQAADCILISTPEYAHGIPGILKNALEWLVCEETMQKPVFVFIASPSGGEYVKEYLLETLRTMDMKASVERTLTVRSARNQISASGDILDPALLSSMTDFLQAGIQSIKS